MNKLRTLKTILFLSGLILAGIGGAILFVPEAFHATNNIDLGGNVSLLSEIRAGGSGLLASGILVMSGAFAARLTFTSAVVSSLIYLSYGLSRVFSIAVDGMPAEGLVQAAALEIAIGLACVFALAKSSDYPTPSQ